MSALPQSLRSCRAFHADFCLCHGLSTSSQVKKDYMIFGGKLEAKGVLLMQSVPSEARSRAQKGREWTQGCEEWSTEVPEGCHTGVPFDVTYIRTKVCLPSREWMRVLAVQAKLLMSRTTRLAVEWTEANRFEISFENTMDKTWWL